MSNRRRSAGVSSIELIAGTILLVPLALLALDLTSIFAAEGLAAAACRDAARSASNGMPADLSGPHLDQSISTQSLPYLRATGALSNYHTNKTVQLDPAMQITETIESPVPAQPLGGSVIGNVTVAVAAVVAPPFTLAPFPQTVRLTVKQTFPYTFVVPTVVP